MNERIPSIRGALGAGLTWGLLWWLFMTSLMAVIGLVDPDSIAAGEIQAAIVVFGPMGLLSGLAFGLLHFVARPEGSVSRLSLPWVVSRGVLGSGVVQLGYLGHGDAGLLANAGMAAELSLFGGAVGAVWLLGARAWSRRCRTQVLHD